MGQLAPSTVNKSDCHINIQQFAKVQLAWQSNDGTVSFWQTYALLLRRSLSLLVFGAYVKGPVSQSVTLHLTIHRMKN